jgi:hypothetical protein
MEIQGDWNELPLAVILDPSLWPSRGIGNELSFRENFPQSPNQIHDIILITIKRQCQVTDWDLVSCEERRILVES